MGFHPFHRPFYGGANVSAGGGGSSVGVSSRVPWPFHMAIGTHGYITEPTKCARRFLNQLRPSSDQSDEPGEQTLNPENLWRRSASSWHLGAGQLWRDSAKEAQSFRFRESKGMDVWTPFSLRQLPDANTQKKSSANTNLRLINNPDTGVEWFIDGTHVYRTADPQSAAPTWTDCSGLPGTSISSATFTGAHLYVVVGGAVYRAAVGSTVFASWYSATAVEGIQYANGRLFAWNANEVFELTAGAAKTTLFTHPQTSFVWDLILGAPNAAYLVGHLAFSSEIYRTDVRDATGALTAPVLSGSIINERVTAACVEGGYVILATKLNDNAGRIRLCQIVNAFSAAGGALAIGPNIFAQLSQKPTQPIDALTPTGRFVYFSWPNLDGTCTGVGRFDISTATQPLVPAYATDQMAGNAAGIVQGRVLAVVFDAANNQLRFAVSGKGVYGTTGPLSFMKENYLRTGRLRFGLLDTKVVAQLQARMAPLPDTMATLTVALDSTANLVTLDVDGGAGELRPTKLPHSTGEWAELTIELDDDDSGNSGELWWWVVSAIPVPSALEQIVACIIMEDKVWAGTSERSPKQRFDVEAELSYLRGLCRSRTIVSYQTGSKIEDVYVNNVEELGQQMSPDNRHLESRVNVEMKTLST